MQWRLKKTIRTRHTITRAGPSDCVPTKTHNSMQFILNTSVTQNSATTVLLIRKVCKTALTAQVGHTLPYKSVIYS